MEMFIDYIWVFVIGGFVCMLGQLLIICTNFTSARILVTFVVSGVFLQAIGVFDFIADFANAGIRVPIVGFGAALAKGAIEAVQTDGLLGAFSGGLAATAGGIAAAVGFAFLFSLVFKSKTKK